MGTDRWTSVGQWGLLLVVAGLLFVAACGGTKLQGNEPQLDAIAEPDKVLDPLQGFFLNFLAFY